MNLVIIPLFNEIEYVETVMEEVFQHIPERTDVLVVEDGSTDGSRKVVEGRGDVLKIFHEANEGYGKSLIDGFRFATEGGYRFAVTMDCDWQHQPHMIGRFLESMEGYDIASGSRYLLPSHGVVPKDRFWINRRVTRKINELTGLGLTDAFCGFKAFRVEAVSRLRLTEYGYAFPIQLWVRAFRAGLRVKEIPVGLVYIDYSRDFKNLFRSPEERLAYYLGILDREAENIAPAIGPPSPGDSDANPTGVLYDRRET